MNTVSELSADPADLDHVVKALNALHEVVETVVDYIDAAPHARRFSLPLSRAKKHIDALGASLESRPYSS